jgi:hypothetical protein
MDKITFNINVNIIKTKDGKFAIEGMSDIDIPQLINENEIMGGRGNIDMIQRGSIK